MNLRALATAAGALVLLTLTIVAVATPVHVGQQDATMSLWQACRGDTCVAIGSSDYMWECDTEKSHVEAARAFSVMAVLAAVPPVVLPVLQLVVKWPAPRKICVLAGGVSCALCLLAWTLVVSLFTTNVCGAVDQQAPRDRDGVTIGAAPVVGVVAWLVSAIVAVGLALPSSA